MGDYDSYTRADRGGMPVQELRFPVANVRCTVWLRKHDPRENISSGALWEIRDFDRQRQVAGGEADSLKHAKAVVRAVLGELYPWLPIESE